MMKRQSKIICAIVPALLLIGIIFSAEVNIKSINNICLFVLAYIYTACIWYFVFFKYLLKSKVKWLRVTLISILVSALLVLVLPFKYQNEVKNNRISKLKEDAIAIEITPLDKNSKSKGNEIYIESINIQEHDYNMYEIPLTNGWEFVDGRPYTNSSESNPITISFQKGDEIRIYVRKTEESGKIRLKYCGYSKEYDLYSSKKIEKYALDLNDVFPKEILKTRVGIRFSIYYICYYVIVLGYMYIIVSLILIKLEKQKRMNEESV